MTENVSKTFNAVVFIIIKDLCRASRKFFKKVYFQEKVNSLNGLKKVLKIESSLLLHFTPQLHKLLSLTQLHCFGISYLHFICSWESCSMNLQEISSDFFLPAREWTQKFSD